MQLTAAANPSTEVLDGSLYQRVARRISGLIEHGTLRPGERIPSVRKLSEQEDVSITTITQAYRVLENEGFIEARPQSGYYVRSRQTGRLPEPEMVRPRPKANKVDVGSLVMEVVRSGSDPRLVNLGTALPAPELFPNEPLQRALSRAVRRRLDESNRCDTSRGNYALRVQIARRAIESGCTLSPADIIVTLGATQALQLALQAVAVPGDTIAVESPAYYGVLHMIESLGLRACEIPTYPRHGVCLDELETRLDCCDIKACVFCLNFSNPLGSCMPDEKKARLVELLARRNIPLIEDDIAGDLVHHGARPKTAKAFDRRGEVLLCGSFSKTLAPGYRIGWVVPGNYAERAEYSRFVTTCAMPSPTQMAVAEFLANDSYDLHLRKLRRFYAGQFRVFTEAITRHFPEGTKMTRPGGGQVLWVELPVGVDSLELHQRALAEQIAIAPGPIFSPTRKFRNFIRLNCGLPWCEKIEQALSRLGRIAKEMAA
jgi:DNA-binding transcriptional MocR family regulator